MMRKTMLSGNYKRFSLNDALHFDMLQFMDDTVMLCNWQQQLLWRVRLGIAPSKFLRVVMGTSSKRLTYWIPLLDKLRKKLSVWNGKHISLGGRIVLLNLVLANLPIYPFSFFKAPKSIITQIIRIQRECLWGEGEDRRKLCWISWANLCRSKSIGGLDIKQCGLFNRVLLRK
ncbi:unnamed protein product [Lathyrus sativus]|nr:unnamed protein product [Lathyrus sativus]